MGKFRTTRFTLLFTLFAELAGCKHVEPATTSPGRNGVGPEPTSRWTSQSEAEAEAHTPQVVWDHPLEPMRTCEGLGVWMAWFTRDGALQGKRNVAFDKRRTLTVRKGDVERDVVLEVAYLPSGHALLEVESLGGTFVGQTFPAQIGKRTRLRFEHDGERYTLAYVLQAGRAEDGILCEDLTKDREPLAGLFHDRPVAP